MGILVQSILGKVFKSFDFWQNGMSSTSVSNTESANVAGLSVATGTVSSNLAYSSSLALSKVP